MVSHYVRSRERLKRMIDVWEQVSVWNELSPIGTEVWLTEDDGSRTSTKTASEAWILGHDQPVVKVQGRTGGFALERIRRK